MLKATEHQIQTAIVQYLRLKGFVVYHIPNEGKRSYRAGLAQKQGGLTAGAPDLIAFYKGGVLCIEVKSEKGVLSSKQKEQKEALIRLGHEWLLARSVDDVINFLKGKTNAAF